MLLAFQLRNVWIIQAGQPIMRIGFDIDGVLANFNEAILQYINRRIVSNYTEKSITSWEYYDCIEEVTEPMQKAIFVEASETRWFWYRLKCYNQEDMDSIAILSEKHNIYFISNRFENPTEDYTLWQTRRWLDKFHIHPAGVIITQDKAEICKILNLKYFIDDDQRNEYAINKDQLRTRCYLLNRPWNEKAEANYRLDTVEDYINLIN